MKMIDYTFGKNNTYLVAVSYGPDSMALLDMMQKSDVKPIVCFVNYHTGTFTDKAQEMLFEYCRKHELTLEICDSNDCDQNGKFSDFENWSRVIRYDFFHKMFEKYNAAAIFIAHQQDDVIENYLTMKQKGIKATRYGWNKISEVEGMIVVRPLLHYTHDDLIEYCQVNGVPYSVDVSKFEDDNQRSAIRRNIVSKLNEVERDQIISEMEKTQVEMKGLIKSVDQTVDIENELEIRPLIALNDGAYAETIINFVNEKSPKHITITPKILKEIRAMCLDRRPIMTLKLQGNCYLVKEYDILSLDTDGLGMPYSYTLEKPGKLKTEVFDLDFSMGAEDRNIHDYDYPITIRSALPLDVTTFGGYLVPVRKMLMASGMPRKLLKVWPVFLNKDKKIIYIPRYKKNFQEYHTSVLKINVTNLEK